MRDAAKFARANPPKPEAREKEVAPLPVNFSDLGLDEELMTAVKELGLSEPTEVQALGIPAVLAGESVAMASHTGSGKTLAYMIPIVQVLHPCIQTRVHHHCGFFFFFNLFYIFSSIFIKVLEHLLWLRFLYWQHTHALLDQLKHTLLQGNKSPIWDCICMVPS
jgi:ATP-dependent helicase YprA (DUF1998 family)